MGIINVSYADLYNAGDLLNKSLVERLSGKTVKRSKVYDADMIAIGGALIGAQYSNGYRSLLQTILGKTIGRKPLYVWGSGFWHADNPNALYRRDLRVCALRGAKTQEKLKNLTGINYDVPLADAGLLADIFLDGGINKKYNIGVIPHMFQQNDKAFLQAKEDNKYHFIDIKRDPLSVIKDISECEYILSSSLHGLIFADSLHIPNTRLEGNTPLPGGNFKFEDYYSCYGLVDQPMIIEKYLPTENEIIDNYNVNFDMVELKKKQLLECFPKF